MLETLNSLDSTQGRENLSAKSISREVDAAALAAFIESEGHIHAGVEDRSKKGLGPMLRLCVEIHNTHPLLLNRVAEILLRNGVEFCWTADYRPKYEHAAGSAHIAGKKRLRKLLELIMPYMSSKKRQAELLLQLIDYRESLVLSSKHNRVGELLEDEKIKSMIAEIKREKHEYPSILEFQRKPNSLLINPSTTTRTLGATSAE